MTSLRLNPAVAQLEEEDAFFVLERALELKRQGRRVINLGIGQPDFLPPAHVLEAAAKAARDGPHGYTSPLGLPQLREAVAERTAARCGAAIHPDEVVIVPGGKVTIYFAALLFGGAGREILYPDPGFPPYREAIRASGATPVPYPIREERDFGFEPDEVLDLIGPATGLVIVNSPANPTGGVIDRETLGALALGLERHPGVAVLSDEIYSHLVYDDGGFAGMLSFPQLRDRLVMLDGWSKSFAMTGWRLGYGIWPRHLVEHVRRLVTVDHSCINNVAQMAGLAAIAGPMDEVERMRGIFAQRRDAVVAGLSGIDGVTCRRPGGAFYAFPNIAGTGLSDRALAHRLLEERHVALVAGTSFGANGRNHLRVSYAASLADIEEAIARLKGFLADGSAAMRV